MREVFGQLATDLHQLETRREAALIDGINDPTRSFAASLLKRLEGSQLIVALPDGGYDFVGYEPHSALENLDTISVALSSFIAPDEKGLPSFDIPKMVTYIEPARKQYYKASDVTERTAALCGLAYIAAALRPEYIPAQLHKQPRETPEQKGFRTAMLALQRIHTPRQKFMVEYPDFYRRLERNRILGSEATVNWLCNPDSSANADREAFNFWILSNQVTPKFIEAITSTSFTGKQLREHIQWYLHRKEQAQQAEPTILLSEPLKATEETGWDILPKAEVLEQLGIPAPTIHDRSNHERQSISQERLTNFGRLALSWYGGKVENVRIAVRNLGNSDSDSDKFQVAILEQHLPNGTVLEHAVGEAPHDRATYVFRAEHGVDTDGSIWLTWRDVFASTKKAALMLGARKINHTKHYADNLLEYLTRDPNKLDKPSYHR